MCVNMIKTSAVEHFFLHTLPVNSYFALIHTQPIFGHRGFLVTTEMSCSMKVIFLETVNSAERTKEQQKS